MRKSIGITTLFLICSFGLFSTPAAAVPLGTEEALASVSAYDARAPLQGLLARGDVQAALVRHGVDPGQAAARVAAMSDADVRLLQERIDALPAGGNVVGAVVFVFFVLVVTDIFGVTDVFPFIQPIR